MSSKFSGLAQAIRDGSQMHPQAIGHDVNTNDDGDDETCAILAAGTAMNGGKIPDKRGTDAYREIFRKTNVDPNTKVTHPFSGVVWPMMSVIIDLNDNWEQSREWIADWAEAQGEGKVTDDSGKQPASHVNGTVAVEGPSSETTPVKQLV